VDAASTLYPKLCANAVAFSTSITALIVAMTPIFISTLMTSAGRASSFSASSLTVTASPNRRRFSTGGLTTGGASTSVDTWGDSTATEGVGSEISLGAAVSGGAVTTSSITAVGLSMTGASGVSSRTGGGGESSFMEDGCGAFNRSRTSSAVSSSILLM
jgi:hypothetical protein